MRGAGTRKVVQALSEGPKTSEDLLRITGLSPQGAFQILKKLANKKCVRSAPYLMDMRQRVYSLVGRPEAVLGLLAAVLIIALLVVPVTADRTEYHVVDCAHFSLLSPHPNGTVYDRFELVPPEDCYHEYLHLPFTRVLSAVLFQLRLHAVQWFEHNYTLSNESLALRLSVAQYRIDFDTQEDVTLSLDDLYAVTGETEHLYGHEAIVSLGPSENLTDSVRVEAAVYQSWNLTCRVYSFSGDNYIYEPSPLQIFIAAVTLIPLTICAVWRTCRMRRKFLRKHSEVVGPVAGLVHTQDVGKPEGAPQ